VYLQDADVSERAHGRMSFGSVPDVFRIRSWRVLDPFLSCFGSVPGMFLSVLMADCHLDLFLACFGSVPAVFRIRSLRVLDPFLACFESVPGVFWIRS
jgi:hypothetical protein